MNTEQNEALGRQRQDRIARITAAGLLLGALGSVGCAATGRAVETPRGPAGAQAPEGSLLSSPCRAIGASRVVASGAFVPAGVEATLRGERVSVRYAHRKSRCSAASLIGASGEVVGPEEAAQCPDRDRGVVATSEGETLMAREVTWNGASGARVELGVVVRDAPRLFGFPAQDSRLVERVFEPPADRRAGGEHSPALASLPGERFLLTWVDENPDGHRLHAQAVASGGEAVGPALDLSPEDVSVIGRASTAIGADGRGIVAFLASNGHGFDVRATAVACELP